MGQIQTTRNLVDALGGGQVNRATGPLSITGAKPGDVLRIDILEFQVGQLKFCQVVDPLKTMRFESPKSVLAEYGLQDSGNGIIDRHRLAFFPGPGKGGFTESRQQVCMQTVDARFISR